MPEKVYVLERKLNNLGTGRTGQFTVRIFRGFACRVLAFDTHPIRDEDRQALGFEYTDLDDLYAQADIVCIQLPMNAKTKHLINSQSIAKMKPGVILINTARGDLIDSKALLDALRSGHVGGVGLDVYENEEKYFSNDFSSSMLDDPILAQLIAHPNVILTARQAFLTDEALSTIAKTTMENVHAFLNSGKPLHSPKLWARAWTECDHRWMKPTLQCRDAEHFMTGRSVLFSLFVLKWLPVISTYLSC